MKRLLLLPVLIAVVMSACAVRVPATLAPDAPAARTTSTTVPNRPSRQAGPTPASAAAPTPTDLSLAPEPRPTAPQPPPSDPFSLITEASLLASLEELTTIQPYSGWRNSASQGEAEALETVSQRLAELPFLQALGLTMEHQRFHVFLSTELWETGLHLILDGQTIEVPADGLRGPRDDIPQALRFDSDGSLNDTTRDPRVVEAPVAIARSADDLQALGPSGPDRRVLFLDYAAIDLSLRGAEATDIAAQALELAPAGLVLVTQFSNQIGESHGSFVGEGGALSQVRAGALPPTLYVRLEDLAAAGIRGWEDLSAVNAARLTWDADVLSPGRSGNLVAHIPGQDPAHAVILGAHIDSPNSPGAMDDGSGAAVLLEVAQVLDAAGVQPPTDLYLVWFGSEELGLYGSYHFVSTHQELLDRSGAMLQIDALTRPLDGIGASLHLVSWSYGRFGDMHLAWPEYLAGRAAERGIDIYPTNAYGIESDNSGFVGFDVPNANLIYANFPLMQATGSLHYASHMHDPYDTVELAQEVGDVLVQMAHVALAAALHTGQPGPSLRVAPSPNRRVVFVGSHTEPVHMSPTTFTDLGMTLAWEGFDVDLVPYGQAVTADDVRDADVVVALPVADYPSPAADPSLYDVGWSEAETAALVEYVARGGFLVLTNSGYRLKYFNRIQEPNEDWRDANVLAAHFGIRFQEGHVEGARAQVVGAHPLIEGLEALALAEGNGVPFSMARGEVLAEASGRPVVALVSLDESGGKVLILGDVGLLGAGPGEPENLPFWQNLAQYARLR